MDDQRDYAEESAVRISIEKEGMEEYHGDWCERIELIPSEHMHGFSRRDGRLYILECADCHNTEECEGYECFWCVPA